MILFLCGTNLGDDLHTRISLKRSQAKNGATIKIEPFIRSKEDPIILTLKPGEIKKSGQSIIIPGRGWPKKKAKSVGDNPIHLPNHVGKRGDLVISIQVVSDRTSK